MISTPPYTSFLMHGVSTLWLRVGVISCSLHVALRMKLFEHKSFDVKAVMGFGIFNEISIGLLDLSLGLDSVGFYQTTKVIIIPCTVLLETLSFKKKFSRSIQFSLSILLMGVVVLEEQFQQMLIEWKAESGKLSPTSSSQSSSSGHQIGVSAFFQVRYGEDLQEHGFQLVGQYRISPLDVRDVGAHNSERATQLDHRQFGLLQNSVQNSFSGSNEYECCDAAFRQASYRGRLGRFWDMQSLRYTVVMQVVILHSASGVSRWRVLAVTVITQETNAIFHSP